MFEDYCVNESYTILEVLERFERNNDRVAVVINENDKVIGVISQGDILRALSSGTDIHTEIRNIISNSFLHLYSKNMDEAFKVFKKTKITLLPVIDNGNRLTDVITLADIYEYLEERIH